MDFKSYLEETKELTGERVRVSLDWYLKEIRKLARKHIGDPSKKKDKTQVSMKEAYASYSNTMSQQQALEDVKDDVVLETTSGSINSNMLGKMMLYMYDPKTKDKLPYYDMFPLIFPIRQYGDGMLGMNMHYIPPVERARLMTNLYSLINSKTLNPNSRLIMTYKLLDNSSRFIYFKPCIKRYLFSHIRSRIMIINPHKWNHTLFLPLAKFMKNTEYRVWQDSIDVIQKHQFK